MMFILLLVTLTRIVIAQEPLYDIDWSSVDSQIHPCDDFYTHACGHWIEKTVIPEDRPMWSRSFSTIDFNNQEILKTILENSIKKKNTNRLSIFYQTCMDEKKLQKQGLSEFKKSLQWLKKLDQTSSSLTELLVHLHQQGVSAFFHFNQEQDANDNSQVIGVIDQGGLTLPDRDFYLSQDSKMVKIRTLYQHHIYQIFHSLGKSKNAAQQAASQILHLETELAKISMPRVQRRDPTQVYHRLEREGLMRLLPQLDWDHYFQNLNPDTTAQLQKINVAVPDFFSGLNEQLKTIRLPEIRAYLTWHMFLAWWDAFPRVLREAHFKFLSQALTGQSKLEERWKRCVHLTDDYLGFELSQLFIEATQGQETKQVSEVMLQEIEQSMAKVLKTTSWMSETTRQEAEKKLSKITNKIGYPSFWRSYEKLTLTSKSFLHNLQQVKNFDLRYELNKIGRPVNKNEWEMTPSTVNAYYNPQQNEMVFPIGILQYPFFHPKSPDWLNYGGIGLVIGHELTHGYDDQGRHFDSNGNLRNWWEPSDLKKFQQKTKCIVNEYQQFEILPGLFVNGELTLGENIADQGGLKLSYQAWLQKQNKDADLNTKKQKFFLAFAQAWCRKEQESLTRTRASIDPHSPSRYRVNGVVSQFAPFAETFQCPKNSKMTSVHPCQVW